MFEPSLSEIFGALRRLFEWRYVLLSLPERTIGMRRAYKGAASESLRKYLIKHYADSSLLQVGDWYYPVVLYPVTDAFSFDISLKSSLDLDKEWKPTISGNSRSFYWLQRSLISMENRHTFIMKRLVTKPTLLLECGISDFFTCILTSLALEWELLKVCSRVGDGLPYEMDAIERKLHLRQKLTHMVNDPVTDGDGRAAAIGVSTLLAYQDHHDVIRLFLRRRGPLSTAYDRGKWHVFPSAMFQAPFGQYDIEFSLVHLVLWEFLEEFYDVPDPLKPRSDPKWFYGFPAIAELREMLSSGQAIILLSGIAVNLASLRPEVLLVLYVKDSNWMWRHETGENGVKIFKFSKESQYSTALLPGESPVMRIELPKIPEQVFKANDLRPEKIVPVGAACLYLGIRTLNAFLSRRA